MKPVEQRKRKRIAAKGHEWSSEYTVDKKAPVTEKGKKTEERDGEAGAEARANRYVRFRKPV